MEETAHLLPTPANKQRLIERVMQDKAGKVMDKQLDFAVEKPSRRRVEALPTKKLATVKQRRK